MNATAALGVMIGYDPVATRSLDFSAYVRKGCGGRQDYMRWGLELIFCYRIRQPEECNKRERKTNTVKFLQLVGDKFFSLPCLWKETLSPL